MVVEVHTSEREEYEPQQEKKLSPGKIIILISSNLTILRTNFWITLTDQKKLLAICILWSLVRGPFKSITKNGW